MILAASVPQLEALVRSPFHLISLIIFILAIIHTLCVYKVREWARRLDIHRTRSLWIHLLYCLSEVEVVFAFWAIPLFICIGLMYGWKTGLEYIDTRDYTEALFVVVILAMASTKPIVHIAEKTISWCAKWLGGQLPAWWFVLLTIGPLLGSIITEAAAMALCALLLSHQFYQYRPSPKLAYATLGLLFVNISVGGVLTNFASPAVLILSHRWHWTISDMFLNFGWKAILGIVLSNLLYWVYFKKELFLLNIRKKAETLFAMYSSAHEKKPIPLWVSLVHVLFMTWIVAVSQYPAIFIAGFLFFIAFHQATRGHQHSLRLARPMLIGLFLAGLMIHGGLQGWWVMEILEGLRPSAVMGVAMALTGFNDNAAISYLSTLIPHSTEPFRYAIFTGVIAGGGLTVIANAPNPAGYVILKKFFDGGIRPLNLFLAALIPTLILYGLFFLFGPLF